jgi:hypothetical protein
VKACRSAPRSRCAASACGSSWIAWSRSACRACATSAAPARRPSTARQLHARSQRADRFPRDRLRQGREDQGHEHHFRHNRRTDEEAKELLANLGMPFRS